MRILTSIGAAFSSRFHTLRYTCVIVLLQLSEHREIGMDLDSGKVTVTHGWLDQDVNSHWPSSVQFISRIWSRFEPLIQESKLGKSGRRSPLNGGTLPNARYDTE